MLNNIIRYSITHKLVIGLLTFALVIAGVYSLQQLPVDAVPDITNNQAQVITTSPTLAAQEVERLITFPIELTMATIPQIDEIRSTIVNVYSPINGVVREVYINTGKYFNPQDVLMDITDATDLHVELKVYEDDIHLLRNGQRIHFRLANTPEKWMEAEVFLIANNVRDDRSITIHGHLKEKNEDLLPGMFVNAAIEVEAKEQYAVPEEAIVRFEAKQYIFKSLGRRKEGKSTMNDFEMLEITKGNEEEGFIAVTFVDETQDIATMEIVLKDAFTLLAKAKNAEDEGGHGH